jgi:hypothetical protein
MRVPHRRAIVFNALTALGDATTAEAFNNLLRSLKASREYCDNPKFQQYLAAEWLTCVPLWAAYARQVRLTACGIHAGVHYQHNAKASCLPGSEHLCGKTLASIIA